MNSTIAPQPHAHTASPPDLGQTRPRITTAPQWIIALILAVQCLLPLWFSPGDHALYAPDEGRYGSVSVNMLETGHWLVPMRSGQPHLTKPPLTYWLQAAAVKCFGEDELSLRLPSLLAATLTVLITFGIGLQWGGPVRGLLAAGLLSLTPLHLIIGRLAITDSLLTMCWTAALAAGLMAARVDPQRPGHSWGWAGLMWAAVATGLMIKGPLALAPVGLLLLWLLFTGQLASIGRLHILLGLPLAVVPIGLWVYLILQNEPEAIAIWRHEMLDRASGNGGDHPEAFWYYIPLVIAGFFPATTTLTLPGIEYSWREAWKYGRTPQVGSLLAIAIIVPFLGFTLMSGKLATYVLPLGPPLSLLGACVLESRFLGDGNARGDRKAMHTTAAITIVTAVVVAGMAFTPVRVVPESVWTAALAAAAPLAALVVWIKWTSIARDPHRRSAALAIMWIAGVITWSGMFEFEDTLTRRYGTQPLMAQVHAMPGLSDPIIATVGYEDLTLFRYLNTPALALKNAKIHPWLESLTPEDRRRAAVLARDNVWHEFSQRNPDIADLFEQVGRGTYRIDTKILILRPKQE